MTELLRPLTLIKPYVGNQLIAMIDTVAKSTQITKDQYLILAKQCKTYDTNMLIDEENNLFVLVKREEKYFGVAPIQKQFYKNIMARTVMH
jgi:hypothetical protein